MKDFQRDRFEAITVSSLFAATDRLRITALAILLLCAVMWCNMFAQAYSFDDHMILAAHAKILQKQKEEKDIYQRYGCTDRAAACFTLLEKREDPKLEENRKTDLKKLSSLVAQQKRLQNLLNDVKLGSTEIPLINMKFSTNDINLVCGIFLTFIGFWMLFSARQIKYIFHDENVQSVINLYRAPICHMFAISNPDSSIRIGLVRWFIIYVAPITLGSTIAWDLYTGLMGEGEIPLGGIFISALRVF
jgi:hypothetical protein